MIRTDAAYALNQIAHKDSMIPTPRTDAFARGIYDSAMAAAADLPGYGGREVSPEEAYNEALELARRFEREMTVLYHRTKAAEAREERIAEILSHIYAHQWPEDMKLEDGRVMRFAPNLETTQMFLRGLWKAIKEIPDAIDKAKKDAPV